MVLFAEANVEQVLFIRDIMDTFCTALSDKINVAKTQICFSKNCPALVRVDIARGFGFEEVKDLGKYLGVPLLHIHVSKATYAYLLERMKVRLPGWAKKSLTLAWRITLAKAVLQAIPNYVMQSSWLSKGMCEDMERLIRSFVWGTNEGTSGIHLISWDMAKQRIESGGLGFKNLHQQNRASLMKIGFQLLTDIEALWVRVLKAKYRWGDRLPVSIKRPSYSRLWTGLNNVWDEICDNASWNIANGSQTSFWFDNWLGWKGRLTFSCLANMMSPSTKVSDMKMASGEWDWLCLNSLLPTAILDQIVVVQPPELL
ncbi:hypothetical protein GQ457_14G017940 [Hibiscus cannabinus]